MTRIIIQFTTDSLLAGLTFFYDKITLLAINYFAVVLNQSSFATKNIEDSVHIVRSIMEIAILIIIFITALYRLKRTIRKDKNKD